VDAGVDPVTVTLTAVNGTMRFDTEPGMDFAQHTITDTVAAINNFLEGFAFVPTLNFNGEASLTVTTNDLGRNGAGGGFITSDVIPITVNAVDDPAVAVDDQYAILEDGSLAVAAPGVLGNDLEVDGDPLMAVLVEGVSHGALTFNPDGSFSYVPAADFNGVDSFTYLVNDGVGDSNVATATIGVASVNDVPAFTKGPDVTRGEDAGPQAIADWATGITAGAANEVAQALTFLVETDNAGLFSALPAVAADGTLTFTSAANAHGVANVTVRLMDDGGTANGGVDTSASQMFSITILSVNDAPTFIKGPNLVVDEDEGPQVFENWATAISVGPADEVGQLHFFEVTNDNSALFDAQPTIDPAGTLRFAPAPDAFGTATVSVVLRDNGGTGNGGSDASAVQTFTITVAPLNDRPVAIGATFGIDEDNVLSGSLTGFDVDGDALTFSPFGPGPLNGALTLEPDGSFTYTPNADFFGADTFGFRVSDGIISSVPAVVTVNVAPVNDAPVAAPESYDLVEDEPLDLSLFGPAFGVLANDVDVDGDMLTAVLASAPANGTLVLNADGTFVYTPNADFFGDDSFTYQARDPSGELSNVAVVSLVVENQNDAPTAFDAAFETDEDVMLEAPLPANDVDGDALTFEVLTGPASGMVELLEGGVFRYTPNTNFFGPDAFTFRASDGLLPSGIGTVSIEVAPVNDAPVLDAIDDKAVNEGDTLAFTATASDPDLPPDTLTFSLLNAPAGASIDATTGEFTWTPTEVQGPGSHDVTIRVADNGMPELFDEETFKVTVNEVNTAPLLDEIGDKVVNEGGTLVFTATASDSDLPANVLAFSLTDDAPEGAAIEPETGLFTWTPTEAQGPGVHAVTVAVDDGNGGIATQGFNVTVLEDENIDAGPAANDGVADSFEISRGGEQINVSVNGLGVFTTEFATAPVITINGSSDDDTLAIDFSGGNPIPAAGIVYQGGGPGDNDTLTLINGAASSINYTFFDAHSGTVEIDGGLISFSGLEPIVNDLVIPVQTFSFGALDDDVVLTIGEELSTISSPTSETVTFRNPSEALHVSTDGGDDAITVVAGSELPFELILDAGSGSNSVSSNLPIINGVIVGTENGDSIHLDEISGVVMASVNGVISTFSGLTHLGVLALGGDDSITLEDVTIPVAVEGGEGADQVDATRTVAPVSLRGGPGNDDLRGGPSDDSIEGGSDDDVMRGGGGDDLIDGGEGSDRLGSAPLVPIAYWNLNEVSGKTAFDSVGVAQDGTYFGDIDQDDAGPRSGDGALFDAKTAAEFKHRRSQYIAVAHDPAFEVANGTVMFWFNTDTTARDQTLFAKDRSGFGSGGHLNIRLDGRDIEVRLQSTSQSFRIDTDNTAFNNPVRPDRWYHLAVTWGEAGMKLYLNGALIGTNSFAGGLLGNHEPIVIGGSNRSNTDDSGDLSKIRITEPFDGHIDEVAFFGEALNAEQIARAMAQSALAAGPGREAAGYSGNLEDYQFAFVGGRLQITDTRPTSTTHDGIDRIHGVEQVTFGDGNVAYLLGNDSGNTSELSSSQIKDIAGATPLVILGDSSQTLHLIGEWSTAGSETIGATLFNRYVNGVASARVLDGIQVSLDTAPAPLSGVSTDNAFDRVLTELYGPGGTLDPTMRPSEFWKGNTTSTDGVKDYRTYKSYLHDLGKKLKSFFTSDDEGSGDHDKDLFGHDGRRQHSSHGVGKKEHRDGSFASPAPWVRHFLLDLAEHPDLDNPNRHISVSLYDKPMKDQRDHRE